MAALGLVRRKKITIWRLFRPRVQLPEEHRMSLLENQPDQSAKGVVISLPRQRKAKWPVVIGSMILAMGAVSVTGRVIIASTMLSVGQLPIIPFIGTLIDVLPIATGVLLIRRQPAGWKGRRAGTATHQSLSAPVV